MRAALGILLAALGLALGQNEPAVAALRVAHLSPDAPQFDLLIDDQLTMPDIAYGQSSGYLLIAAGRHDLKLFPHRPPEQNGATAAPDESAGNGDEAGDEPDPEAEPDGEEAPRVAPLEPLVISVDLEPGGYYTLAAVGFYDPLPGQDELSSLILEAPAGTELQVRGPRAYLVTLTTGQRLEGLEPGDYTVTASREGYRSAEYEVTLRGGEATTLPINLQEGEDEGDPSPEVAEAILSEQALERSPLTQLQLYDDAYETFPSAGHVLVRFIHAAPSTGPIDVYAFDELNLPDAEEPDGETTVLVPALSFPNASPYLELPVSTDGFEFRLGGTTLSLATVSDLDLATGSVLSFYLVGSTTTQTLVPLPTVDAVLRDGLP